MFKLLKYGTLTALHALSISSLSLAAQCDVIDNIYAPQYLTQEDRQQSISLISENYPSLLEKMVDEALSEEQYLLLETDLIQCLHNAAMLGDKNATYNLANILKHQVDNPDRLKETYFLRSLINAQDPHLLFTIKIDFLLGGKDQSALQKTLKDQSPEAIRAIFSPHNSSISNLDELTVAYENAADDMVVFAHYLLENSPQGSLSEIMGIITMQEYGSNTEQSFDQIDHQLTIADFLTRHLQYRASYDSAQKFYQTAQENGSGAQKERAEQGLAFLSTFLNTRSTQTK